jgi:hypothetical protein
MVLTIWFNILILFLMLYLLSIYYKSTTSQKINESPEDGFVRAETCRLFEYIIKIGCLGLILVLCTLLVSFVFVAERDG